MLWSDLYVSSGFLGLLSVWVISRENGESSNLRSFPEPKLAFNNSGSGSGQIIFDVYTKLWTLIIDLNMKSGEWHEQVILILLTVCFCSFFWCQLDVSYVGIHQDLLWGFAVISARFHAGVIYDVEWDESTCCSLAARYFFGKLPCNFLSAWTFWFCRELKIA